MPTLATLLKAFLAIGDLLPQLCWYLLGQAGVLQVAVRKEHCWHPAINLFRSVEIAGDEEARQALKEHL